jgi:hypothetical protein
MSQQSTGLRDGFFSGSATNVWRVACSLLPSTKLNPGQVALSPDAVSNADPTRAAHRPRQTICSRIFSQYCQARGRKNLRNRSVPITTPGTQPRCWRKTSPPWNPRRSSPAPKRLGVRARSEPTELAGPVGPVRRGGTPTSRRRGIPRPPDPLGPCVGLARGVLGPGLPRRRSAPRRRRVLDAARCIQGTPCLEPIRQKP